MQGTQGGRSLERDNSFMNRHVWVTSKLKLTVAFDHEWFYNIMADQLEVGMANPVTDGCLGTSEEIVQDSDLMTENHETVYKMRPNETSTAGNQDALALRRREKLHWGESRECGIRDRLSVCVEYGLREVGRTASIFIGLLSSLTRR